MSLSPHTGLRSQQKRDLYEIQCFHTNSGKTYSRKHSNILTYTLSNRISLATSNERVIIMTRRLHCVNAALFRELGVHGRILSESGADPHDLRSLLYHLTPSRLLRVAKI